MDLRFVARIDTHEIEDVVKARVIRTRIAGWTAVQVTWRCHLGIRGIGLSGCVIAVICAGAASLEHVEQTEPMADYIQLAL